MEKVLYHVSFLHYALMLLTQKFLMLSRRVANCSKPEGTDHAYLYNYIDTYARHENHNSSAHVCEMVRSCLTTANLCGHMR